MSPGPADNLKILVSNIDKKIISSKRIGTPNFNMSKHLIGSKSQSIGKVESIQSSVFKIKKPAILATNNHLNENNPYVSQDNSYGSSSYDILAAKTTKNIVKGGK